MAKKKDVVKTKPDADWLLNRIETLELNITALNQRIDRIVAAIDNCKRIKGM